MQAGAGLPLRALQAVYLSAGLVHAHHNVAALPLVLVQGVNGLLGILSSGYQHNAEAARAVSAVVHLDISTHHVVRSKQVLQLAPSHAERQVAHVQGGASWALGGSTATVLTHKHVAALQSSLVQGLNGLLSGISARELDNAVKAKGRGGVSVQEMRVVEVPPYTITQPKLQCTRA